MSLPVLPASEQSRKSASPTIARWGFRSAKNIGAASALLAELIGFAKNRPALRAIHLGVYENNERAISLYEEFGFVTVGRFRDYFQIDGKYFDEILMDLYL